MKLEDKEDPVIIPTLPDQHQLLDIRPNVRRRQSRDEIRNVNVKRYIEDFYNRLSKILSWVRFQNRSHGENFGAELVLTILTTDLSVFVSLYSPLCSPVQFLAGYQQSRMMTIWKDNGW